MEKRKLKLKSVLNLLQQRSGQKHKQINHSQQMGQREGSGGVQLGWL